MLGWTVTVTDPLPLPPAETLTQAQGLYALQEHSLLAVTFTPIAPPLLGAAQPGGVSE